MGRELAQPPIPRRPLPGLEESLFYRCRLVRRKHKGDNRHFLTEQDNLNIWLIYVRNIFLSLFKHLQIACPINSLFSIRDLGHVSLHLEAVIGSLKSTNRQERLIFPIAGIVWINEFCEMRF